MAQVFYTRLPSGWTFPAMTNLVGNLQTTRFMLFLCSEVIAVALVYGFGPK